MTGPTPGSIPIDPSFPCPDFDLLKDDTAPFTTPIRCYSQDRHLPDKYSLIDVTPTELKDLITNPSKEGETLIIIDVRYFYERKGRILGSVGVTRWSELMDIYNKYKDQNVFIIFHCEFSHARGPHVMRRFRAYDRSLHLSEWPNISFKKVGLLVGGYSEFYKRYPDLCVGGYVRMLDRRHVENGDMQKGTRMFHEEMGDPRGGGDVQKRIRRCVSSFSPLSAMGDEIASIAKQPL